VVQSIGRAARAEGCLRTLTAERRREICALALLQEDDRDKYETNDDVQNDGLNRLE